MKDRGEAGKKEKVQYSIQLVSEGNRGTDRQFSVRLGVAAVFLAALVLLLMAAMAYCFVLAGELSRSNQSEQDLTARNETLSMQNEELLLEKEKTERENEELQEKVEILSDTVNGKVKQEREREAEIAKTYVPTGFPLKGSASYNENETELGGNPIAVFQASEGTSVVATANGTVLSVAADVAGYTVTVDHGNGYRTVYRNGAMPKVKEGDVVTNTTELFAIEGGKDLGYQIIENEQYINPLNLMEMNG